MTPTIHASAILLGHNGILIRGPSGSGKSRLALALLQDAGSSFARLVGDDRIHLEAVHGRLLMRPAKALEGLMEIRGAGIVRLAYESVAVVSLVIDLGAPVLRLPQKTDLEIRLEGITLARLPVAPGTDAMTQVRSFLAHKSQLVAGNLTEA